MCRELCICFDILRLGHLGLDGRHLGHFRAERGAASVRAVVVGAAVAVVRADIGGGLLMAGPEPPDGRFHICFSFLERQDRGKSDVDHDVLFAECAFGVVVCEEVAARGGWTFES